MRLERIRQGYELALEWLVIALMALLAIEVTAGILFRTFGHSLVWYDEVASILLAWLTFYGSALAAVKRAHIGCPELVALLPPMPKVMVRIVVELMVIAFFLLLGWSGYAVLDVLATDHLVSLPSIPVSWAQSVIPVSAALIVVAELLNLPRVVADARHETEVTGGASH
jgi:TRAP-type C4-dicarboxylate transport system permease small subunit